MAYPPDHGISSNGALRLVLVLVGVSLVGYTVGPPLYWRLKGNSTGQASCPSCVCDCSSEEDFLSVPLGEVHFSLPVKNFLIIETLIYLHIYVQLLLCSDFENLVKHCF